MDVKQDMFGSTPSRVGNSLSGSKLPAQHQYSTNKVHSMAVKFIKQLHQESLEKAWNARPAKAAKDPMPKRRQNVLGRIDTALAQLKNGDTNPPRGSYQTRENFTGVRVQLKYGQRALTIDGRDHWFVEDAATTSERPARLLEEANWTVSSMTRLRARQGKGKGKAKAKGNLAAPKSKPLDPEKVYNRDAAREDEANADEQHAAKPGRFAQRYEKMLAASKFSEPAL